MLLIKNYVNVISLSSLLLVKSRVRRPHARCLVQHQHSPLTTYFCFGLFLMWLELVLVFNLTLLYREKCRKCTLFDNLAARSVTSRQEGSRNATKGILLAERATPRPASEGKAPGNTPNSQIIKEEDRNTKMRGQEDCQEDVRN